MNQCLHKKVAIITGGASGIGLGTVEAFIEQGAMVVIADIDTEKGEAAAKRFGDKATFVRTDVSDEQQIGVLVESAVTTYGRLDVMFNNAGSVGDKSSIMDVTLSGFMDTMQLLAASVVMGHKYAAKQFVKQGTGGSIITTSSIGGLQGGFSPISYVAAKSAILGIIRQATFELGPLGIRSNAIIPGATATPIIGNAFGIPEDKVNAFTAFAMEKLKVAQPLGSVATPGDIAGAAIYLASDLSKFVSGTSIVVDGGITAVNDRFAQIAIDASQEFMASQQE